MASRNGVEALRLSVRRVVGTDEVPRTGGRYDLVMSERGVDKLSNAEVADIFANMARETVLFELEGENYGRA